MSQVIVVGLQWGDEGKGKIVDLLTPAFDAVARFQGGNNAGHTVRFADRHLSLHLLPSGIVRPDVSCVLGNGMVIAPDALREELEMLEKQGIEAGDRLFIAARAHVILPTHVLLDTAREEARGTAKIGTTLRGIGPAYEMKVARCGVRIGDLHDEDELTARLRAQHQRIAPELAALGADPPPKPSALVTACRGWADWLSPRIHDTSLLLDQWLEEGKSVLFEGAQGTLLDLDFGTYPYVTSSPTIAGGVMVGAGVAPGRIDGVLGVLKAYVTRVGSGPFPTELDDEDGPGAHLRRRGNEFGTTTGRPRRCGWFDAVAARYARRLSGVDNLALTKLDVLDELEEISICVGYRVDGEELSEFPWDAGALARAEPIYETLPGWQENTAGALRFGDLPKRAQSYVRRLRNLVGARIALISSGPRREETILIDTPLRDLLRDRYGAVRSQREG